MAPAAPSTIRYKYAPYTEAVMTPWFSRLLVIAATIPTGSEAKATDHFIQTYINAQGGCGSGSATPLSIVLAGGGLQAPFGKSAGDWTNDDLAALPQILAECERTAAGVNRFRAAEIRGEARDLEARVPRIIQAARVEQAKQAAQLQARRDIAQSRIDAARQRAEADRATAEEVQKLEAEANRADAEARIAAGRREQAQRNARERQADAFTPSIEVEPQVGARVAAAPIATFGFDAPTFRQMYDARLRNDGDDGIADCTDSAGLFKCKFDEASFKKSVDAFKKFGLANGDFSSKLRLVMASQGGRVSKIVVAGDRADPMNLSGYVGKVGSLLKTLEPEMSDQAQQSLLTSDLGLMRGDNDLTVGAEKLVVRKSYIGRCRQSPSSESTAMICTFGPRS